MIKIAANSQKLILLVFFIIITSCASIDQKIKIAPIPREYPISATSSIWYENKVIRDRNVQIIDHFKFEKKYSAKLTEHAIIFDLEKELDKQINLSGADGITELKIKVLDINSDTLDWIVIERYSGVILTGCGLGWLAYTNLYTSTDEAMLSNDTIPVLIASGTGLLLLGGSILHENLGTIEYIFEVEGNTVYITD